MLHLVLILHILHNFLSHLSSLLFWKSVVAIVHVEFGPNSDIIMESDGRSNTSLPYDDIDEAVEAQTSPAATAAASGDKFFHEAAVDQSTGKLQSRLLRT